MFEPGVWTGYPEGTAGYQDPGIGYPGSRGPTEEGGAASLGKGGSSREREERGRRRGDMAATGPMQHKEGLWRSAPRGLV